MRNGAGFALIYAARILFDFAARAVRASLGACWRFCSWARGRGGLRRRKRRAGRGILARFCVAAFAEIMNNQPLYLVDNDTFLPLSCYYNEICVATPPPFHCKNFKPTNRNIMKKTSLILLSTLCALAANAVVDIPGSTSSTGRPVVKDIADGQDIRLLPNAEAPTEASNISMAGATVKSIEIAEKAAEATHWRSELR